MTKHVCAWIIGMKCLLKVNVKNQLTFFLNEIIENAAAEVISIMRSMNDFRNQ